MTVEERVTALEIKVDNLTDLTKSVHEIALSLRELTIREANTETQVTNLSNDMAEIKAKPVKHWEAIISAIIASLVGAFIAYVLK